MVESPVPVVFLPFLAGESSEADWAKLRELAEAPSGQAPGWEALLSQLERHRAAPLFHKWLTDSGRAGELPPEFTEKLRESYLQCALANTRLYLGVAKILRALNQGGIPVIALKGVHLAELVYGNIALRPMVDFDLLIRREDLPLAEEKLAGIGYHPNQAKAWYLKNHFHCVYKSEKPTGITAEVHWHLAHTDSPFNIDIDGLWERAQEATISGEKALVLCPEDLLLYLCLHGCHTHLFSTGVHPLIDVSAVVKHSDIDWEAFRRRVCRWGAERPVFLTLYLAREIINLDLPDGVLDVLKPNDFGEDVARCAVDHLFSENPSGQKVPYHFLSDSMRGKAVKVLKKTFPGKGVLAAHYSLPADSPLAYLHYPRHLLGIARTYVPVGWNILLGNRDDISMEDPVNVLRRWLTPIT